jgi:uncharacterized membrane protein
MATQVSESEAALSRRIAAVDVLRGLIMIVMALDHTRDFFSSITVSATDPTHSWPVLFFTRWITHLCAPGFVALAGTSVYLQKQRGWSCGQTAGRLLSRGVWLIFLELAVVSPGIFFTYHFHFLQVIYAIGGSMIILAALQFLGTRWVAGYGLLVVLLHNMLDRFDLAHAAGAAAWKLLLVAPSAFMDHGQFWALLLYPIVPWSGVMALGYAFGAVVSMPPDKRRKRAVQLGISALAVFAELRFTHSYGDPNPFVHLQTFTQSTMSFFNVMKYPPSLEFVCVTLGVLLLLFALFDWMLSRRLAQKAMDVVEVYGRVPLFYYLLHFYLLHIAALLTLMVVSHTVHVDPPVPLLNPPAPGAGFSLPVVYAIWAAVVAALYLPCRWFASVKARRKDWWLSYL